ncbi:hypothetical protein [Pseudomonas alliivorans]|uniref:hypothetical protein n=1 Tax=Pseudomonas alliivorans TaxID=2810613 RepID=UPI0039DF5671
MDAPYLSAVVQALEHRQVRWTVATLPDDDLKEKTALLNAIGVPTERMLYRLWSEFHGVSSNQHL